MRSITLILAVGALSLASCKSSSSHPAEQAEVCREADVALAAPGAEPATESKAQPAAAHFGGELKLTDADAIPAEKVLASPNDYRGRVVRITGKVGDVCPKRGCWLRIVPESGSAGGENIFIKLSDPASGMLVPRDAVGKRVIAEGELKVGLISQAAARHFKQDAGAPQGEIEKIVGPQKQTMLSAPAVAIEGLDQPAN